VDARGRNLTVLIAVADDSTRGQLRHAFQRRGFRVLEASGRVALMRALEVGPPGLAVLGPCGAADELPLARELRRLHPTLPVVLVVRHSSEERVLAALRAGVADYFSPPLEAEAVADSVDRHLKDALGSRSWPRGTGELSPLIGGSRALYDIRDYIKRVALTDSTVMITGETGTGKELVAQLVHGSGPRRRQPFVSINCAAIPDSLLESELFGHEKGAFTGAHAASPGKLEQANGGSAFFDEIGDMNAFSQAKILRAIETREIHRLGGRRPVPLDVRVIAATNQDLERLTLEGRFRKDLFFRLNVARIHVPPLRERVEDLPALVQHYIAHFNGRFGREVEGLTPDALQCLTRYDWPGNVRELRNIIEAIFVDLPPRPVAFVDLPERFRRCLSAARDLPESERERLLSALSSTNWNKSRAAERLRWSRMTLYRKLAKYQLERLPARADESPPGEPPAAGEPP
jgi:DNA-binding NtrC family response regulator